MSPERHQISLAGHHPSHSVSVVIPAYNAADFLARAIDSALGQTLPPSEVIVVDDGSTDGTKDIVRSYEPSVRYIRQKNSGAAAARNTGAAAARGDLLAFLDSDDRWHPRKLECQVPLISRWPGAAFCACGLRTANHTEQLRRIHVPPEINVTVIRDFRQIFRDPYFGTPTVVMPREVFDECSGFDEDLVTAEDIDLWMRASFMRPVILVEEILVDVFRYPGSLSSHDSFSGNLLAIARFCKRYPDFARSNHRLVRRMNAEVYTSWASAELEKGNETIARELLRQGIQQRITVRGLYLLAKSLT